MQTVPDIQIKGFGYVVIYLNVSPRSHVLTPEALPTHEKALVHLFDLLNRNFGHYLITVFELKIFVHQCLRRVWMMT